MLPSSLVLANWLQVLASVGAPLGVLGLVGTAVSVFVLRRQTRALETASMAAGYQSIIAMSSSVNKLFIEKPSSFSGNRGITAVTV